MAEKKQSSIDSSRKSTRRTEPTDISSSKTVSTPEPTVATARNTVIEGNAAVDLNDVRRRAYEIYEERGGEHGLHEDDWYRAEQEVRGRRRTDRALDQKKSA